MDEWDLEPDAYLAMVREEIPGYDALQDALADATGAVAARHILDLGSGTGITAAAALARHPGAALVGLDGSAAMLVHARAKVPAARFVVGDLRDELPPGPFDLVVSAFAIHHLEGPEKADLFRRVAAVLAPGGRFALCDVVLADEPVPRPVPLDEGHDVPSRLADQVEWLTDAGLAAEVVLARDDVAVVVAGRPGRPA